MNIYDFLLGSGCTLCALFVWSLCKMAAKPLPEPPVFDASDVKSFRVIEEGRSLASVSIEMEEEADGSD